MNLQSDHDVVGDDDDFSDVGSYAVFSGHFVPRKDLLRVSTGRNLLFGRPPACIRSEQFTNRCGIGRFHCVTHFRREQLRRLNWQLLTATLGVGTRIETKPSLNDAATLRTLDQHVVNL
jgi:hypothetical protein